MKRRLYANLALTGQTLKDWFVQSAKTFCSEAGQLQLFGSPTAPAQSAETNGKKTQNS